LWARFFYPPPKDNSRTPTSMTAKPKTLPTKAGCRFGLYDDLPNFEKIPIPTEIVEEYQVEEESLEELEASLLTIEPVP
jgi:hypothetical protein